MILFNGRIVGSRLLCDKKNDDIFARTFNGSKGHSSEVVDTLVAVVMANAQTSLAQVRPAGCWTGGPYEEKLLMVTFLGGYDCLIYITYTN